MIKSTFMFIIVSMLLFSCIKEPETEMITEPPVAKKVVYNLFAAQDYSAPTYDNVQTTLKLSIGVASTKTGAYTKLWDSTIGGHLRTFPLNSQKIQIEKEFSIVESAEQLQVSYNIRYDNNGQLEQVASFKPVVKGTLLFQEDVSL